MNSSDWNIFHQEIQLVPGGLLRKVKLDYSATWVMLIVIMVYGHDTISVFTDSV